MSGGDYVRVYSRSGQVAHLLGPRERVGSGGMPGLPLCRALPLGVVLCGGWWGTGSQQEYDRAAALPTCKRCTAKAPAGDPTTPEEGRDA